MALPRKVLICAFVILIIVVPLWPAVEKAAAPMDEGSLLVYPELILKGHVPYRDFETFYGPANLWVLSGTYAIFSTNIFVERAVGLLYRILILAAIFAITQRWNTTVAAGCTFLAGLLLLPLLLPAYAWMGGMACALWSIYLLTETERPRRILWAGILAGSALLFRPDLGPAVILAALPLLLPLSFSSKRSYVFGGVLALLPLLWLTFAAGPQQLFNNLLLFPVVYCNAGRRLAISSADGYVICLFFVHVGAALVNVLAGAIAVWKKRSDSAPRLLLSLALFGLGLTHQAAQRFDLLHVLAAAFVSIGVLPVAIFILLELKLGERISPIRDGLLSSALVVIAFFVFVPEITFYFRHEAIAAFGKEESKSVFVRRQDRSFPVPSDPQAIVLARLLKSLESGAHPGDRLFVGPADLRRTNYNNTYIYYMMPQLTPATYFLEMNPGSANRPNSRLASDVASADWLVLDHVIDAISEENESTKYGSDLPMRVVKQDFELFGHYGPWELYRKRKTASL